DSVVQHSLSRLCRDSQQFSQQLKISTPLVDILPRVRDLLVVTKNHFERSCLDLPKPKTGDSNEYSTSNASGSNHNSACFHRLTVSRPPWDGMRSKHFPWILAECQRQRCHPYGVRRVPSLQLEG